MNLATIHSLWTVLLMILFLGIVIWAYSSRRKKQFDAAARMPLEDDDSHLLPQTGMEIPTDFPSPSGRGQRVREIVPRSSLPLTPIPSPEGRGGRAEHACAQPDSLGGEPSALRATSFTRGDEKHG